MRILFIGNPQLHITKGGDRVQMLETKKALQFLGHEVDLITSDQFTESSHSQYDIYHLFNAQYMNSEGLIRIFEAKEKYNIPVAISTIYWDLAETNYGTTCARLFFGNASPLDEKAFFDQLALKKLVLNIDENKKISYSRYQDLATSRSEQIIRSIFAKADILLPNSFLEVQNFQHSLLLSNMNFKVVTNAVSPLNVDAGAERHPLMGDEPYVLSVTRKDDRKNLFLIAEAVKQLGYRWIVVGSDPLKEYVDILRSRMSDKTVLIEKMEQKDLVSFYKNAKVHINASFWETPSLSSLEAGYYGECNLVVGNRSAEIEYFKDYAYYCDPFDVSSIKNAVEKAYKNHEKDRDRRQVFVNIIKDNYNWYTAAKQTLEAYNLIKTN